MQPLNPYAVALGWAMKIERQEAGFRSRKACARAAKMERSHLACIELGHRTIRDDFALRWCATMGLGGMSWRKFHMVLSCVRALGHIRSCSEGPETFLEEIAGQDLVLAFLLGRNHVLALDTPEAVRKGRLPDTLRFYWRHHRLLVQPKEVSVMYEPGTKELVEPALA